MSRPTAHGAPLYAFTHRHTWAEAFALSDRLEAKGVPVWLEPYVGSILLDTTADDYNRALRLVAVDISRDPCLELQP